MPLIFFLTLLVFLIPSLTSSSQAPGGGGLLLLRFPEWQAVAACCDHYPEVPDPAPAPAPEAEPEADVEAEPQAEAPAAAAAAEEEYQLVAARLPGSVLPGRLPSALSPRPSALSQLLPAPNPHSAIP